MTFFKIMHEPITALKEASIFKIEIACSIIKKQAMIAMN
jgi:hypothetical protein